MKQKEIAKEFGYSISTLQRYRYDKKMPSPYKSNNPKRTPKTSNDLKRPQMTSKDVNENDTPVSKKIKTKNSLRGGDPNDVNPIHGSIHIEQAFSSPING